MLESNQTYSIESLATAWHKDGGGVLTPSSEWICVIEGCTTIAYVALKTKQGALSACLKHFNEAGARGVRPRRPRLQNLRA